MTLRVIGAGLARTGTTSLKIALEHLLGQRCYHMQDVFVHPDHIPVWHDAIRGDPPDWRSFFAGYAAATDLPASAFWRELAAEFPGALILLSVRDSPEQWWESMSATILDPSRPVPEPGSQMAEYAAMAHDLFLRRLRARAVADKQEMIAAYERHNDAVRADAPRDRLLEWRPADGWAPIAAALGLPAPREPFPYANTRSEFRGAPFGVTRRRVE